MSMRYDTELLPDIKVIGVGGGGCNAVNRMVRAKIPGVQFIAVNTDAQALASSEAPTRIRIGEKLTKGLGVGGDPTRGERAADESRDELYDLLRGTEMVFVTAGMGGGTGTGAAPVVAEIAKDIGALTIGVVTKPFPWEGARRMKQAEEGLARLRDKVDTLIAIPNGRLIEICPPNATVEEAFETADDVLRQAIQSISNIISQNGSINLDFNDVRTTMSEAGPALLAVGKASGENRAIEAARAATTSPILDQSIEGAHNVLFNITHSGNLGLRELDMAARVIAEVVDPAANIIFGTVVDPRVGDEIHMTVIATGFAPRAATIGDPVDAAASRIRDYNLPGVANLEDAELPAFLRRNIRSLNSVRQEQSVYAAKMAERR
ncbi:cell division protein FtsZ [Tepidiforma sp.]|uniref:cell division protein FtsZ n=1 Tax=Tepidiforma sp. TaxID=2682230 RepID=UPI002ADE246F|nr:cell division protein FtsZ [Tepidiforma sp.]